MEKIRDSESLDSWNKRVRENELSLTEPDDYTKSGNMAYRIDNIIGDMGENVKMDLLRQVDGDVILQMVDYSYDPCRRIDLEFCSPGSGGGHQPIIHKMLSRMGGMLVKAIHEDKVNRYNQKKIVREEFESQVELNEKECKRLIDLLDENLSDEEMCVYGEQLKRKLRKKVSKDG